MGLFSKSPKGGPDPGTVYEGPACYVNDYEAVERPGFYALTDDGKDLLRPLIRLVMVDDAPNDPDNGHCHLEVAYANDGPQKTNRNVPITPRPEAVVEMEAHDAQGTSSTEVQ